MYFVLSAQYSGVQLYSVVKLYSGVQLYIGLQLYSSVQFFSGVQLYSVFNCVVSPSPGTVSIPGPGTSPVIPSFP